MMFSLTLMSITMVAAKGTGGEDEECRPVITSPFVEDIHVCVPVPVHVPVPDSSGNGCTLNFVPGPDCQEVGK